MPGGLSRSSGWEEGGGSGRPRAVQRSRPWSLWLLGGVLWTTAIALGVRVGRLTAREQALARSALETRGPAEGRVVCSLCGARERQTRVDETVGEREPIPSPWSDWWRRLPVQSHEHDWIRVGCWYHDGWVCCYTGEEEESFFGTLPRFEDQVLARAVALRLIELDPETRRSEIQASEALGRLALLFTSSDGDPGSTSHDGEEAQYESWRSGHPIWQDLFPPTLAGIAPGR